MKCHSHNCPFRNPEDTMCAALYVSGTSNPSNYAMWRLWTSHSNLSVSCSYKLEISKDIVSFEAKTLIMVIILSRLCFQKIPVDADWMKWISKPVVCHYWYCRSYNCKKQQKDLLAGVGWSKPFSLVHLTFRVLSFCLWEYVISSSATSIFKEHFNG